MDGIGAVTDTVNRIHPISVNSLSALTGIIHYESIPEGETFIHKGTRNEFEYIILDGVCRSCLTSPEGEDVTVSFYQDKSVITPNVARTFNHLSSLNFQALTKIKAGVFKANDLVVLMRENPELRSFANAVLQNELIMKVNKEIYNASLPAKERLLAFRKQFHSLENIIPHTYIASYQGCWPFFC